MINDLLDKILSSKNEEKKKYITDNKVKELFINNTIDYPLIWLIQSLDKEELDLFFDEYGINLLSTSENICHKLNALVTLDSSINYDVISNEKIINLIYRHFDELKSYLNSVHENFIDKFIDYVIKNDLDFNKVSRFRYNLYKVINKYEDIIIEKNLINNLSKYDNKTVEELLKNSYYEQVLYCDKELEEELIFNGVKFNNNILKNKYFINNLVEDINIDKYRFLINQLYKTNNMSLVDEIVTHKNMFYDEIMNTYLEDKKMFKSFNNIFDEIVKENFNANISNEKMLTNRQKYELYSIMYNSEINNNIKKRQLNNQLIDYSTDLYFKIIVDRFFEDVQYNFIRDLNIINEFNEKHNVLEDNNIYKVLQNLMKNRKVDIDFYKDLLKYKNYLENHYDDFKKLKDFSYNSIKNNLVSEEKIENQKNNLLSSIYDTDIYDFNGQPFYLIVHNTSFDKYEVNENLFKNQKDITSLSLISNDNLTYFHNHLNSVLLGFKDFSINNIEHLYNSDSYSKESENGVTDRINKLYTAQELMDDTLYYNEIVYRNDLKNPLKPSYVITFDNEIGNMDLFTSRKYNIPIINIDSKKYPKIKNRNSNYMAHDTERYVNNYFELENNVFHRKGL